MGRNLDPKCRQCRRVGEKLYLKGERCDTQNCAMVKRKYPPGVHGPKQRIRLSEYGLQLREKQKARKTYGMLERQFRSYFKKASKMQGDAGYNFLNLLEHRLDNVVFKAGLAASRDLARQAITHGHILVNGKKLSIPSYIVKIGDLISVKDSSFLKKSFEEKRQALQHSSGQAKKDQNELPSWMVFDTENKAFKIISDIGEEDIPKNIDIRLIVEFYSK